MSSTLDEFQDNLKVCTTSITNVCDGVSPHNSDSITVVNRVCQPSDVSQTNGQKQCIDIDQSNNGLRTRDCASQTQNQNCDHLSEELRDALKKVDRLFDLTNNVYNSISRLIKETPVPCGNCMLGKNASGSNAQSISAGDIGENIRKCNELSIELEGVKLDAVITESRLSNNIYQNSKAIEQIHSQMINMQNIQNITDERSTIANREQSNTHTISKQNEISENPCNKSVVLQDEQFCLSHGHQSDKLQSKVSNNSNSVRDYQCENSKSNCNTVEGKLQGQPFRRCKTKTTLPMCLGNLPLIELPSSKMQKNKQ
ncbi:Hypothetical predicted protein, partial [Paramuricea clavata]